MVMYLYRFGHIRAGRRVASILVLLILALLSVAVSRASAHTYHAGPACCANRQFSPDYAYVTKNYANDADNQVLCVQEQVFPHYPSGSGAFFDGYKCQPRSVSHSLNGANVDRALCWVNGSEVTIGCAENY